MTVIFFFYILRITEEVVTSCSSKLCCIQNKYCDGIKKVINTLRISVYTLFEHP